MRTGDRQILRVVDTLQQLFHCRVAYSRIERDCNEIGVSSEFDSRQRARFVHEQDTAYQLGRSPLLQGRRI